MCKKLTIKIIAHLLKISQSAAKNHAHDIKTTYEIKHITEWHFKDYYKLPQELPLKIVG